MEKTTDITSSKPTTTGKPEEWENSKSNQIIEKLMQEEGVNIYLEEKVDQKEDEDRYQLVVESKQIKNFKRHYSLRDYRSITLDLLANGQLVSWKNFSKAITLILADMKKFNNGKYHTGIGWFNYNDIPAFSYDKVATAEGELLSEYRGSLELNQKGNIKDYMDGIRELVVPQPKLFTVYVAGASGIVVQALQQNDTNIMLNICGESSIGKTIAENVALSFWGKAQAQGFNTINRTEEILAQRFIMPMTVDDMLSACGGYTEKTKQKQITEYIFRFSTGRLKGRMGQKDSIYYGASLFSSEFGLLDRTLDADTSGQIYRMIELQVNKGELTKDDTHAKKLNQLIRQNYGLGVYELGKFMVQHSYIGDKLEELYEMQYSNLVEDSRLANHSRTANRLAILMVTAILLNECFNLHADLESIKDVLIESVYNNMKPLDRRKVTYPELQELIEKNKEYFADSQGVFKPQQHIGVFTKNTFGNSTLIIPTKNLMPLLHNVPLSQILVHTGEVQVRQPSRYETRNILSYWKNQGWLCCGGRSDQLYMKRKLGDSKKQELVYVVVFERSQDADEKTI